MATVATLTIDLIGNSAKLNAELRKATKGTEGWAKKTRASVASIGKVLAGAGVVAGFTAIYLNAAKTGDALAKLSDRIGEAPERLIGLGHAAELTGAGADTLNKSMEKMVKSLGEARNGTGEAAQYIERMGLSTEAFFSLSPADQFSKIADKVSAMSSQQEKAAAAAKLFGDEGLALVNTLDLGSAGLAAVQQEAEQLGLTLSRVDLAKIEAANDSFYKAKEVTEGFGRQLAVQVAPLLDAISQQFVSAAKEAGGFGNVARSVVEVTASGIGVMADGIHGIEIAYKGLQLVVAEVVNANLQAWSAMDEGLTALLNKLPGVEAQQSEFLTSAAQTASEVATSLRKELGDMAMEKIPSEKIKDWMEDAYKKADAAAKNVAANATVKIPVGLKGEDSAVGLAGQNEKKRADQIAKEVEAQREKFSQIHEAALAADKKVVDLENYRAKRQQEELQREFDALKAQGAMTAELEAEFHTAKEEQELAHQARLQAIKDKAEDEERKKTEAGYSALIGMAESYNDAKGKSSNKYTAVALKGMEILASKEKRDAVKSVARDGVKAIQKAWGSLPFPENLPGVALATAASAANFATVTGIAHGGMDYVPKETTYLLDKGERVVSPSQNRDLTDYLSKAKSGGGSVPSIQIINQTGVAANAEANMLSDGTMQIILRAVDSKLQNDLGNGRGVWGSAARRYGWSTKGAF